MSDARYPLNTEQNSVSVTQQDRNQAVGHMVQGTEQSCSSSRPALALPGQSWTLSQSPVGLHLGVWWGKACPGWAAGMGVEGLGQAWRSYTASNFLPPADHPSSSEPSRVQNGLSWHFLFFTHWNPCPSLLIGPVICSWHLGLLPGETGPMLRGHLWEAMDWVEPTESKLGFSCVFWKLSMPMNIYNLIPLFIHCLCFPDFLFHAAN